MPHKGAFFFWWMVLERRSTEKETERGAGGKQSITLQAKLVAKA